MNLNQELRNAKSFGEIFEIVKKVVYHYCEKDQAGLMLGICDLGSEENQFIGAFYVMQGNMIVINKRPLQKIMHTNHALYNAYVFHVLLHEYIHSLGIVDEMACREITHYLSSKYFGANHTVTQLAENIGKFMPQLVYPDQGYTAPEDMHIEFVCGFDRANTNYIM